jgi:hypothetical protein
MELAEEINRVNNFSPKSPYAKILRNSAETKALSESPNPYAIKLLLFVTIV